MTKQKTTKRALILSVLTILMCILLLIGGTFAWFTDSVTSSGNKIEAGNFAIDLELLSQESGVWESLKDQNTPLFSDNKWEPGYTEVKVLRVENEGDLTLKWLAKFVSQDELSALADVIDVYTLNYGVLADPSEVFYPADRTLEGYTKVGTLKDFIETLQATTTGVLKAGEKAYLGLALKMQETADNEYRGLSLGGTFDIKIVATQMTDETDSFDNSYDAAAPLNFIPVSNENELEKALASKEDNIVLTNDIPIKETLTINYPAKIDGAGYILGRGSATTYSARTTTVYTGEVFTIAAGATLTLENIVVDGGAVWTGEIDPVLKRGTVNEGVVSTNALVIAGANSHLVLGEGAILQNNDGALAVNLGTRIGATLTLDGGKIINNNSDAGAIWGGGHITVNSGSISYNSSTGVAGAIRMVSNCNLNVNGGEISYNKAATSGGVAWGYGASTYNFNGGKIYGNSAGVGGVLYTGDGSIVNVGGDVEIFENVATDSCGAFRLSNRTAFNMIGGKIYGNISQNNSTWAGFYGWNVAANITGGQLDDAICLDSGLACKLGGNGIGGVVYFALNTNHNTAYLTEQFGTIKFNVAEDSNFAAFNIKPATSYTYTEGDEAKLICLNEGYTTYYDTATGTFKIKK